MTNSPIVIEVVAVVIVIAHKLSLIENESFMSVIILRVDQQQ